MKKLIYLIPFLFVGIIAYPQIFGKNKLKEKEPPPPAEIIDPSDKLPEMKIESKKSLEPYRYDGAKTTYFLYKPYQQRREIEIFFLGETDYKVVFNGGALDGSIGVEIYDRTFENPGKTMIYENKSVGSGLTNVTHEQLISELKKKKMEAGMSSAEADLIRLKKAYINYIIPNKSEESKTNEKGEEISVKTKGIVLLTMGYLNI